MIRELHNANPLRLPQPDGYFGLIRTDALDVLKHYQIEAQRVVEIGCGQGTTGAQIKALLGTEHYLGVEVNAQAGEVARAVLDQVIVADLQSVSPADLGVAESDRDLLLALDVLEHLYNPWDVLAEWVRILKPGGKAVLSIPNIQNIKIISELAQGRWSYASSGLLDATHLRFFTGESLGDLIKGAGLAVHSVNCKYDPDPSAGQLKDTGNEMTWGKLQFHNLTRDELLQLMVWQYVIVAERVS